MKTNLEYYPRHVDSYRNAKFKLLRQNMGFEAEARFWILNDIIAESDDCILDMNKIYIKADVLEILKYNEEQFKTLVAYLLSEECKLIIEIEPGKFTTERVQERLSEVMKDRKRARDKKVRKGSAVIDVSSPELFDKSEENEESSGYKVNQTKLKESKEKQTKEVDELADVTQETLKKAYKTNPEYMFIRYWNRHGSPMEIEDVKKFLNEYDIEKIIYAFHESMKHKAFNLAYLESILKNYKGKLLPDQAKSDAVNLESQSKVNHKTEQQDTADLEKKNKEFEKQWRKDIVKRFNLIKTKIAQKKRDDIQKAINENKLTTADALVYEFETGEKQKIEPEISGVKSLGSAMKVIINT